MQPRTFVQRGDESRDQNKADVAGSKDDIVNVRFGGGQEPGMLFKPVKVAHEDLISPNEKTQVEVGYYRNKMVKYRNTKLIYRNIQLKYSKIKLRYS